MSRHATLVNFGIKLIEMQIAEGWPSVLWCPSKLTWERSPSICVHTRANVHTVLAIASLSSKTHRPNAWISPQVKTDSHKVSSSDRPNAKCPLSSTLESPRIQNRTKSPEGAQYHQRRFHASSLPCLCVVFARPSSQGVSAYNPYT